MSDGRRDTKVAMLDWDKIQREVSFEFRKYFDQVVIAPTSMFSYTGIGHRKVKIHGIAMVVRCPLYFQHVYLSRDIHAYALYNYACKAAQGYIGEIEEPILDEETPWPARCNYRSLLMNTLWQYNLPEHKVVQYWNEVDSQFRELNRRIVPDEERYRFNQTPELKLH